MQDLKVTLIQTYLHWEDKEKNLSHFDDLIERVKENTDLIVLPEMFNTGFSMNPSKLSEKMNQKTMDWMKQKASGKNCVVTGSIIINENNNNFNRLIWMSQDGTYLTYDKRHLFSLAKEENFFSSGQNKLIAEIKEWKICPQICYDLRFPAWCRNHFDKNTGKLAFDCLLFVANWPEKRSYAWKNLLIARALENQSYVIGVNRIGIDGNDMFHSGDSALVDFAGEVLFTEKNNEFIKTFTLSAESIKKHRRAFQFYKDADTINVIN